MATFIVQKFYALAVENQHKAINYFTVTLEKNPYHRPNQCFLVSQQSLGCRTFGAC
jgi:hypothetical protein